MLLLKVSCVLVLGLLVSGSPLATRNRDLHPDVGLNVLELITRYGYPVEQHTVTTEDGYVLEMHRIPHGLNNANETGKPVALVQHGLLSSSADWVNNNGPANSLGFLLADRGYDVWLGNFRGNTWSRKHITLDPDADADAFWDFSWDQMGRFDLPAKIDYITSFTGVESIFYVGHSQGTTAFFVMASERPEYNSKIKLMSALAPIAFMSHLVNPFFQVFAEFENSVEWIANFIGINEFLPNSDLMALIGQAACSEQAVTQDMCSNILFLIAGYDSPQLDPNIIPVISTNTPAGSATKQFFHYAQGIKEGFFRKYDYGFFGNLEHYGSSSPPDYDLSQISAAIALFYSGNDWLSAIEDVDILYSKLPHVALKYKVSLDTFNHLDYMWAIDVTELVYGRVMDMMDRYNLESP